MDTSTTSQILLPPINRSMRELDRQFFQKTISISTAVVRDSRTLTPLRKSLEKSGELFRGYRTIVPIRDYQTDPSRKCILLAPHVKSEDPRTWSRELSQAVAQDIVQVEPYALRLTYDDYPMAQILDAVLPELPPEEKETPAGFAQAGHVAHLNLRTQYLPFKHMIGQILLDKNSQLRTVINKTLSVGEQSEFRTFPYEILAGEDDLNVTVSSSGCDYKFNFAQVYWNTRLEHEHQRLVAKFQPGEAVCDVMAGVGPFAIPAGKRKVFVRANDLNPAAVDSLTGNIARNKVGAFVTASCEDGRQFIRNASEALRTAPRVYQAPRSRVSRQASEENRRKALAKPIPPPLTEPPAFDHFVMNLPAIACEFLDTFAGLYHGRESEFTPNTDRKLPMIHVHTFQARMDTAREDAEGVCAKVSEYLGAEIKVDDEDVEVHDARLVAPNKRYMCASFRLPPAVAFAKP